MWAQLIGTSLGGLLVLVTNFLVGRQQHSFERRRLELELHKRLRHEKFQLIREFWHTARILEGWAQTAHVQGTREHQQGSAWDDFWNVHVLLDSLMSEDNRPCLTASGGSSTAS